MSCEGSKAFLCFVYSVVIYSGHSGSFTMTYDLVIFAKVRNIGCVHNTANNIRNETDTASYAGCT